jgi:cysteine desulfurase
VALFVKWQTNYVWLMPAYFDCAATAPLCPAAREALLFYIDVAYGNAGSRTHQFGADAKTAVQKARAEIAAVVDARPDEVVFTSGATEANNLAILGLRTHGLKSGRRHIVTTKIEHKAVLEPVDALAQDGFEVSFVAPGEDGRVLAEAVLAAVRDDTLLVSVMHANNETGALQPVADIAAGLARSDAYLHVDAAQSFGKELDALRHPRIEMISASGHKIYGPKGVGALIARRGPSKIPLQPLLHGGGQERGLRPGTLPVPLIAAFGAAASAAVIENRQRREQCTAIRTRILDALLPLGAVINGSQQTTLCSILN